MARGSRAGTPWYVVAAFVLALVSVAMVALGGPLYNADIIGLGTAFTGLRWGVYVGGAAAILCLVAGVASLAVAGGRGAAMAFVGLIAAGIAAYMPYSMREVARSVPPIHDISTDMVDPPAFVDVAPLRADAPNPVAYAGPEVAAKQAAAYPDLKSVTLPLPPDQAFPKAEAAARAMGWEIVSAVPADGRIEATATTLWFGFKDDVVIRLRPSGEGTLVDVRSKSRVGGSDLGANAARIRAYLKKLTG